MAILTASNLGQSFGAFDLFSSITVSVANDGKVGLVGPNGIGKTTLLLILAGLSQPSAGSVQRARGSRLGYLPQEAMQAFTEEDHTVYNEMLTVFADLRADEAHLRQMEAAMAEGNVSEALFERYSNLLDQFEAAGGYDYDTRTRQVLTGLGFQESDWQLPLGHLSGGQKTRALLARLLLEKPGLLILDEPTNHLDVEAIEWLENTLNAWDGAILVVSHDRYFLDKVVNTIWEMSRKGIEAYHGNYTAYQQQRQERWAMRQEEYEARMERLAKELEYIRRNIAGQRTLMAKGKLSRLSRELDALQRGGSDAVRGKSWSQIVSELGKTRHSMNVAEVAQAIKELERPSGAPRSLNLGLQTGQRSGNIVLRTKGLTVGYPGKVLFTADDIELRRLECAALIGPNGSGKTTFLRTVQGLLEPLAGEVKLGASLKVGYFAQAHEALNLDNTVLDELLRYRNLPVSEARSYLGRYLFQGDDVHKKILSLSGGERGRLALAILALEGANFLLLDEPTNHLDIPSQETLQETLEQFEGTILMVTHDRYLVDRLATQIWNLHDGRLDVFEGPYEEYLAWREATRDEEQKSNGRHNGSLSRRRNDSDADRQARKRAGEVARLEAQISTLEAELERLTLEIQMVSQDGAYDLAQALGIEYKIKQNQLDSLIAQWGTLAHE